MDTVHLIAAAAVVVLVVVLWLLLPKPPAKPALPYWKRPSLLTAGELRFYRVLLRAVPPGLTVFVKVRLMDLVNVPDKHWQQYGAPASGMHVDFVIADPETIEPCLVIELDDRSHQRPEVQKRDAFKNAALAAVRLPVLRVKTATNYNAGKLREQIEAALG